MSRLFMFEKPLGMRDTLPKLYEKKHRVRSLMEMQSNNGVISLLRHLHLNIMKPSELRQPFLTKSCSNYLIKMDIHSCYDQI